MYRLGIIEKSIEDRDIVHVLSSYFISQRIEMVPEDECPIWHVNEYQVAYNEMERVADILKQHIKETWYSHAFNDKSMFVILKAKISIT